MKAFLFAALIFAGSTAMARPSSMYNCTLASGWDSLQSFQFVNNGGVNVSINGNRMRDTMPSSPYGIFHSPAYADYYFMPRPSTPGPSIDVLKKDRSRLIYHCNPLN